MAAVDYGDVLRAHGVEVSSKNQSQGNIGVNCPLCRASGDPDPSFHLGINADTGAWYCWRNPKHKGRSPHRFFEIVLGKSGADVDLLIGARKRKHVDDFDKAFAQGKDPFAAPMREVSLTQLTKAARSVFRTFPKCIADGITKPHYDYLATRTGKYVDGLIRQYDLRAGIAGKWAGRLIMPVYQGVSANPVSWVGRAIYPNVSPKYKALSAKIDSDEAGMSLKSVLSINSNKQIKPRVLVIVEGKFDLLRLSVAVKNDVVLGCSFGLGVSPQQVALAHNLNCPRVMVMYDAGALDKAARAAKDLGGEFVDFEKHFPGIDDPGNLPHADWVNDKLAGLGLA